MKEMTLYQFLKQSIQGKLSLEEQKYFLCNFELKTPEELKKIVLFFRENSAHAVPLFTEAIDVCGTGGSGKKKINVSTLSALLLMTMGVKVAKHGNRAITGACGSFDLLESLGLNFSTINKDIELIYRRENGVFLYAPFFYPAIKHFAEVRKVLGKPSFFNLLGPLLSPVQAKKQIIGTVFKDKMKLMAEACKLLGSEHVYIVSSEDGFDEISLYAKTHVVELKEGAIKNYTISPEDFGLKTRRVILTQGGSIEKNKKIAAAFIAGRAPAEIEDAVLVNAALGLKLAGQEDDLKMAYQKAKKTLHGGRVQEKVEKLKKLLSTPSILLEIIENKKAEVIERKKEKSLQEIQKNLQPSERAQNFLAALRLPSKHLKIIAEVKLASPSKGRIAELDPLEMARKYEKAGAAAISVLCDEKYFNGGLDFLEKIAKNTKKTPILCKDFIVDEYQIYEARKAGADMILLIGAILTKEQMGRFLAIAKKLKMLALCEVHTKEELKETLKTSAAIIGINNRDLHTFKIDLNTTAELLPLIPKNKIIISESGFQEAKDLEKLPARVRGILVGTALMQSENLEQKFLELSRKKCKIKICGVQTPKEALICQKNGVDFIGLNFTKESKRKITLAVAQKIIQKLSTSNNTKIVGVFKNQLIKEVNQIAETLSLDYVQLSGEEKLSDVKASIKPVIKTISITELQSIKKAEEFLPHVAYILLDSTTPGSGQKFNHALLNSIGIDYFLAGGLNAENIPELLQKQRPLGIDLASGVETNGERDLKKLNHLLQTL